MLMVIMFLISIVVESLDKPSKKSGNHKEEREKLGLIAKGRSSSQPPPLDQPTNALQKVEVCVLLQIQILQEIVNLKSFNKKESC